jgi:hypothetical protein
MVSQMGIAPEHVELSTHCTQEPVESQTIAPASVHWALFVQPGWHARVVWPPRPKPMRQMGPPIDPVQSAFVTQATHVRVVGSHRGIAPAQFMSVWHCTHLIVAKSHTGAVMLVQSVELRQPTHAPVTVSQRLGWPIPIGQVAPPSPHAAWHVWSPGQQIGCALPQSAFARHWTHDPFRQCWFAPQVVSVTQ